MKKHNSPNTWYKKQLKKIGINPVRITNETGSRVWKVTNKEFKSLVEVASEYLKKED